MIGVAFSIGFTLGPAFGAYLSSMESRLIRSSAASSYTFSNAAFFSLALSVIDLVFIWAFLDETLNFEIPIAGSTNAKFFFFFFFFFCFVFLIFFIFPGSHQVKKRKKKPWMILHVRLYFRTSI